ncbi:MAG: sensor histidine kinase [Propionibacteriaceae bacterium]|nr:sensor histidine kinase [Propionibacteriaceae bacterium]
MLSLSQLIGQHSGLSLADAEWLTAFVREWHLLADTSFSDLLLWVPGHDDNTFWAVAQIRPNTGPTALDDDVVGEQIAYDPEHPVTTAYLSHDIVETTEHVLAAGNPVGIWAVPIMQGERCIGVVERHTNQMGIRAPGELEDTYLEVASVLTDMLWHGLFPLEPHSIAGVSPKVGDGLIRTDESGVVTYASPNALSAYRRLGLVGDLVGENVGAITLELGGEPTEESKGPKDGFGRRTREVTIDQPQASLRLRTIPLTAEGVPVGSLMLCVDTTALRERERQLVTKDATIREIHHRVKNNLQTVAALLRLQSRRMTAPEAKAALKEAVSRVQSIAVVHEILSQSYDETVRFDAVADQLLAMVGDMAATSGTVRSSREGSFGLIPADAATSLALALTELCQNAVEHGFVASSGSLLVHPTRKGDKLVLEVSNDGQPLPKGFALGETKSLGLSIVRTLVEDLGGTFTLENNPDGSGTTARIKVRLNR